MQIALSPCPNDTFLFYAWIHGLIPGAPQVTPVFADVQTLNEWAIEGRYPLTKVSFGVIPRLKDNYHLLPVGAALGHGCGPKLIAKKPISLEQVSDAIIAIPGKDTTANLLLERLLEKPRNPIYTDYNNIIPLLQSEEAEVGLIIHETRFTFRNAGMSEIVDLGALWEDKMGLPIPLGGIVVKQRIDSDGQLTRALRMSLEYAWANPEETMDFVLQHSAEKDSAVVKDHIALYVTKETHGLSDKGRLAIQTLLEEPACLLY